MELHARALVFDRAVEASARPLAALRPPVLSRLAPARRRFSSAAARVEGYEVAKVPTIDLGPLRRLQPGEAPPPSLVQEVADACADWGFFQVVNHGVDSDLCARAVEQQHAYFSIPWEVKESMRRTAGNSRGWYNDELTKQRRDWKEGLDFGATPPMDWALADDDAANGNLDGFNQFPPEQHAPHFRSTILAYYDELTDLAAQLTRVFALGLGAPADFFEPVLQKTHTSYLRLNYYGACALLSSLRPGRSGCP